MHSVTQHSVTGWTEEFSQALAAISRSESERAPTSRVALRRLFPQPFSIPLSKMVDSQGDVSQNVICHNHTVTRNALNHIIFELAFLMVMNDYFYSTLISYMQFFCFKVFKLPEASN